MVVGEGLTGLIFDVREIDFGEENVPYWTTIGHSSQSRQLRNYPQKRIQAISSTWIISIILRNRTLGLAKRLSNVSFCVGIKGRGIQSKRLAHVLCAMSAYLEAAYYCRSRSEQIFNSLADIRNMENEYHPGFGNLATINGFELHTKAVCNGEPDSFLAVSH
ncbi:hypothetical protein Tco_1348307, partial [Tanacetum coccineum]